MSSTVLTVTDTAQEKITSLRKEKFPECEGLRVAVQGGGCSGLQYKLGFDNRTGEDFVEEHGSLIVLVDPKSAILLAGSTVDYVDELNESGFKIDNPNATNSCGCGKSFSG